MAFVTAAAGAPAAPTGPGGPDGHLANTHNVMCNSGKRMSNKPQSFIVALLLTVVFAGCGEETPTSAEMDCITIQVRHTYHDINFEPRPDEYYRFRLEEGDEFVPVPYVEGMHMFKLIDVIDPLHAEIQFEHRQLASIEEFSDSFTVIVGLKEVVFTPSVSYPEVNEYYCVRVSFGGY